VRSPEVLAALLLLVPLAAAADDFSYRPTGELVPGSGKGRVDDTIYAPDILFPIEQGQAFANSQVWGVGGSSGPSGSQCDAANFVYPWHDNYCETRTWDMPLCPSGTGHQGQDVRASDCMKDVHWTVAVTDGTITSIGSYSVYLTADDGTRYDYLHMRNVAVTMGQRVTRGQHMGKVSDNFGTSSTTVHLHFNVFQNVAGVGMVYVPPYTSLIKAYRVHLGLPDGTPDAPLAVPDARTAADARAAPDGATGPAAADARVDPVVGGDAVGGCALAPGSGPGAALALAGLLAGLRRPRRRRASATPRG
jgi:murein DD-endopeptidase MepM/ murein hydrolase activator NlpD